MKCENVDVDWAKEFNGSITVCNLDGIIVYMNQNSIHQFKEYGGEKLIGTNLLDCHPEPSKSMLQKMLVEPVHHMYTTEKEGVRKMIYQTPWKKDGVFCGIIEISFQLNSEMPNYIRK